MLTLGFLRKKKYKVHGRTLIIENKSRLSREYIEKIKAILLVFFETEELLFKFRRIHILFWDSSLFGINPEQIRKLMNENGLLSGEAAQPDTIKIDLSHLVFLETKMPFEKYKEHLLEKRLKHIVIHEAYHLLHFKGNSAVDLFKRRYEPNIIAELEKILESIGKPFESPLSESLKRFRTGITSFLGKVWIEGMATFLEGLYNGRLVFDKDTFAQLYSKAESHMQRIGSSFALFKESLPKNINSQTKAAVNKCIQAMEKLQSCMAVQGSYAIGEHIFYSIRYLDPGIDDEKIMGMHIYEIILTYEKLMLNHKHQPVISLYSGSGIFDYKGAIKFISVDLKRAMGP